ncbi:hypothetical protein DRQ16_03760 [bacterium]|nr:MAG: hypothetical protein DRQ16_03760 [bacterium]RKZ23161.1 MAG: hypothetical protein DRQ18_01140 [bacterium]
MKRIWAIAFNTWLESVRDKVLLVLGVFGFFLLAASRIFIPIGAGEGGKIICDFGLAFIEIISILVVVFIGTRIVFEEIERKSIYLVLTKPVKRWEFILGKYTSQVMLVGFLQFLLFVFFSIFLKLYTLFPVTEIWKAFYFFFFEACLVIAVAMFFSSFTTPISSGFFTLFFYFIGHATAFLKEFGEFLKIPSFKILMNVLYYVLPNFSIFNIKGELVYRIPTDPLLYPLAFSYSLLYSTVLLLISIAFFERREFP